MLDEDYLRLVECVRECEELLEAHQGRINSVVEQLTAITSSLLREIQILQSRVTHLENKR